MIKVLFICRGSRLDSRELAALVGQNGANFATGIVRDYSFTTNEELKTKSVENKA